MFFKITDDYKIELVTSFHVSKISIGKYNSINEFIKKENPSKLTYVYNICKNGLSVDISDTVKNTTIKLRIHIIDGVLVIDKAYCDNNTELYTRNEIIALDRESYGYNMKKSYRCIDGEYRSIDFLSLKVNSEYCIRQKSYKNKDDYFNNKIDSSREIEERLIPNSKQNKYKEEDALVKLLR